MNTRKKFIHTTATGDGESLSAGKEVQSLTAIFDGFGKRHKVSVERLADVERGNAELLIDGQRVESDYTHHSRQ